MNTIDQRILIPAPPDVVWQIISNVQNNPEWQADCRSVSVLTNLTSGQGLRYRAVSAKGRDYVVEITAWYEGVGYAYRIVDGSPYKSNKGTIRLQEIPEGTIVQWMFEYDLSGLFSGVRNAISTRRNVENAIIESLETLWRTATTSRPAADYVAKSLVREAPDVEARMNYQPRHPSAVRERGKTPAPIIDEPPIQEDDTRPRQVVDVQAPEVPSSQPVPDTPPISASNEDAVEAPVVVTSGWGDDAPPLPEPDFLSGALDDEPESKPAARQPVPSPQEAAPPPLEPAKPDHPHQPAPEREPPVPEAEVAAPPPLEPAPDPAPPVSQESSTQDAPLELPRLPMTDDESGEIDTSKVSVFDIFGIPKPSETQQMRAITAEDIARAEQAAAPPTTEAAPTSQGATIVIGGRRMGLRVVLRSKRLRVRTPK
ncbi:MAG: SRPBCC family protein [Chloroflexota bacterium]